MIKELDESFKNKCTKYDTVPTKYTYFFRSYQGPVSNEYIPWQQPFYIDNFQNHIQAPFQLSVIILSTLAQNFLEFFVDLAHVFINLLTFETSMAWEFLKKMQFDIADSLYTTLRGLLDILTSTLQLITRPLATAVSCVGSLFDGPKCKASEEVSYQIYEEVESPSNPNLVSG